MGATLAFTEMISAKALLLKNTRTRELLKLRPDEQPTGAQLFGNNPVDMAAAAELVEEAGFDLIDVNMGCPVRKVVSNGSGAALMKNLDLAGKIVAAIRRQVKVPVTAKIRAGWSKDSINAAKTARVLEDNGLSAIIVHPRTRDQGYSGAADWKIIGDVVESVKIPVVGNGDVVDGASAINLFKMTGCAGIMVGRAALGNPWIFREISSKTGGGTLSPNPDTTERYTVFLAHFRGLRQDCGRKTAFKRMKKLGSMYIKGFKGAPAARKAMNSARSGRELVKFVKNVLLPATPSSGDKGFFD